MHERVPAASSSTEFSEDVSLARRAFEGEPSARHALLLRLTFIRARLRVRNRAMGYPFGVSDLEDLEQDVMLRVLQSLPRFLGRSSLQTWAGRMCEYSMIDLLRQRRRAARTDWIDDRLILAQSDACQLERASLSAALEALAREGPQADLWLVVLHARDRVTFETIARREQSTPGAIKARYYRALVRLRALLERA